jgi:hypothetical protein
MSCLVTSSKLTLISSANALRARRESRSREESFQETMMNVPKTIGWEGISNEERGWRRNGVIRTWLSGRLTSGRSFSLGGFHPCHQAPVLAHDQSAARRIPHTRPTTTLHFRAAYAKHTEPSFARTSKRSLHWNAFLPDTFTAYTALCQAPSSGCSHFCGRTARGQPDRSFHVH